MKWQTNYSTIQLINYSTNPWTGDEFLKQHRKFQTLFH
ncbi:hypothetical protein Cabys_1132 [Caldithrix abyssi DSM 13497]|uniref:Uncharacterized protein n=1 Tax=Caldithrix abyssi DSM 13497 TaxID=880073 RepID=A0A1J1C6G4_CALAY|nr:hypothetical protein Cabys_1125 [Caldithrix abyssi DSM 13497]APF17881.1 hypothetical protein Cabys_1132 [Caldithrix abyssi DSM 13497]